MASHSDFVASARRVLEIEKAAIEGLVAQIDGGFSASCELIQQCRGKVIITGMGKSGHIAKKIAATLASTGTPAFFVHPAEASHGDLGMMTREDILLAISNSGGSDEVINLIPAIKRLGIPLIAMTANPESTLAQEARLHISIKVPQEACPLGLAPTSSTTATLVMGDALAVALLEAKGFTADDFALSHPAGTLGRRLLLRVEDIMHKGDAVPVVPLSHPLGRSLLEISHKGLGMTAVINEDGSLAGIFTDGDLRRVLDAGIDLQQTEIAEVMTANCITVKRGLLAVEALKIMEDRKINGLLVVDDGNHPVGALNMHDLLKARVL